MKTVIEMARSVGATAYTNRHYPERPTHTFSVDQLERLVELVRADEQKAIYDLALHAAFQEGADLLMPESEVDENAVDDFFKSSEFRYAMNNTVKATVFVITAAIRARSSHERN